MPETAKYLSDDDLGPRAFLPDAPEQGCAVWRSRQGCGLQSSQRRCSRRFAQLALDLHVLGGAHGLLPFNNGCGIFKRASNVVILIWNRTPASVLGVRLAGQAPDGPQPLGCVGGLNAWILSRAGLVRRAQRQAGCAVSALTGIAVGGPRCSSVAPNAVRPAPPREPRSIKPGQAQ